MAVRRISGDTIRFLKSKPLTDKEKSFIISAIRNQQKYFQLTPKYGALLKRLKKDIKKLRNIVKAKISKRKS